MTRRWRDRKRDKNEAEFADRMAEERRILARWASGEDLTDPSPPSPFGPERQTRRPLFREISR